MEVEGCVHNTPPTYMKLSKINKNVLTKQILQKKDIRIKVVNFLIKF